jgi:hypothetical protein
MIRKTLTVFIWMALAVQVTLVLAELVLKALAYPNMLHAPGSVYGEPVSPLLNPLFILLGTISVLSYPLVGMIIFTRRPELKVGWLFCIANIGWTINNFISAFVFYAYTARPALMPLAYKLV